MPKGKYGRKMRRPKRAKLTTRKQAGGRKKVRLGKGSPNAPRY